MKNKIILLTKKYLNNLYLPKILLWTLISSASFAFFWIFFAKTEEIISVNGKLEPIEKVKEINLPIGSYVKKIFVNDFDSVKQNQLLIELDNSIAIKNLKTLEVQKENVLKQINQYNAQIKILFNQKETNNNLKLIKDEFIKENINQTKEIVFKLDSLLKQGGISKLDYLEIKKEYLALEAERVQNNLLKILDESKLNEKIKNVEIQILKLKNQKKSYESQIFDLSEQLEYKLIKSPTAGRVFNLNVTSSVLISSLNQAVMQIIPHGKLEAIMEVPSNKIGYIEVGQTVEFTLDSLISNSKGFIKGEIISIGPYSYSENQFSEFREVLIPVKVILDEEQLNLLSEKKYPLRAGIKLKGNIKLRKVSYLNLFIEKFKSNFDNLRML